MAGMQQRWQLTCAVHLDLGGTEHDARACALQVNLLGADDIRAVHVELLACCRCGEAAGTPRAAGNSFLRAEVHADTSKPENVRGTGTRDWQGIPQGPRLTCN